MAAEWTAVRRGLSIRRAAHRPPRGRRKVRGHRPIVAPSLASALAVVGLGVAVALAKGKLERRADRAKSDPRERRNGRPALRPGEPLAEGLRRVILEQLDLAIELLESYPAGPLPSDRSGEHTVHETRKALKRLRALLALLRPELGRGGSGVSYARENAALRDCARRLAGARDAEVMVGTLDGLLAHHPRLSPAHSPAIRALRAQLLAERDAAAHAIQDPRVRREVLTELRAVRTRAARWRLRERGFKLLAPGLDRLYLQGRRGLRTAQRRGDAEALHRWRKRVKDLRYAAETLDRTGTAESAASTGAWAAVDGKRAAKRRARDAERVRRVARRADSLGEVLGEEHDLALLARWVRRHSGLFAGERGTRKRLLKLISRRRKALRRRALRKGERLYRRKPQRFARRLRGTA
jgi:hypothetical protein